MFTSWNTAWRWLKVPRSTSSPVRRMAGAVGEDRRIAPAPRPRPSRPSARRRSSSIVGRFSRTRSSLRWIVKPSGSSTSDAFSSRSVSSGTAVSALRRGARPAVPPAAARRSPAPASARPCVCCSASMYLRVSSSACAGLDGAALDQRVRPDLRARSGARRSSGTSAAA